MGKAECGGARVGCRSGCGCEWVCGYSRHPDSVCPLSIVDVGGCVRRGERERERDKIPSRSGGHQASLIQLLLLVLGRSCA